MTQQEDTEEKREVLLEEYDAIIRGSIKNEDKAQLRLDEIMRELKVLDS